MDIRPYGQGALFSMPLLDTAGLIFETATAAAAGDFQLQSDEQAATNLTAEFAAFTSGSVKPSVGDTLTGQTSTETCVYIGCRLTSGSWAGGDAAGTMFVASVSGVFTAAETINNTTESSTNDLTLTADFTPSIGAKLIGDFMVFALTAAEMACTAGEVLVVDAGAAWLEDSYSFQTINHQDAMHGTDIIVTDINDASAETTQFTVTLSQGSKILVGMCQLTSGALKKETRLATWTGNEIAIVQPTSVPAGLTTIGPFSAAPADNVTISFKVLD